MQSLRHVSTGVGVIAVLVILFFLGAEFGRREAMHAVPLCQPNEYIMLNKPLNEPATSPTDLLCIPFNQRPSK